MRDRIFFPLAFLLAAGMVYLAIAPGLGRLPTGPVTGDGSNYNRITVEDTYLNKIIAGGDAVSRLENGPDGKRQLYIEADAGVLNPDPELGPHFRLAGDMEVQYSGFRIRCTVRARPADDKGAMQMALNYSAGRVGESGWKEFDLVPGFNDYSFEFNVPVAEGELGVDYFAIRPVVPEKTRALIVQSVTFERLERWKN
ncbi:MAG: hypothetical protein KDA53_15140 [Hyphomonas sp.]|nr:hypothetical protein [Hyphomonas sp.]